MQQMIGEALHEMDYGRKVASFAGELSNGYRDGSRARALFSDIRGMAFAPDGLLFIADSGNRCVRALSPSGEVTTLTGHLTGDKKWRKSFSRTYGVDEKSRQQMAGGYRDGSFDSALFGELGQIVLDRTGSGLILVDLGNSVIRRLDLGSQTVSTLAGSPQRRYWKDGSPLEAGFKGPVGVAMDKNGTVFISDMLDKKIRRLDSDGKVYTIAGSFDPDGELRDGPGVFASFSSPMNMDIDSKGRLYIADNVAGLVRRITPFGRVSTYAGNRVFSIGQDGVKRYRIVNEALELAKIPEADWKKHGYDGSVLQGENQKMFGTTAVLLAPNGDVYVSDIDYNAVFRIPKGKKREPEFYAGDTRQDIVLKDGPARMAVFSQPQTLALDPNDPSVLFVGQPTMIRKIYYGTPISATDDSWDQKYFSEDTEERERYLGDPRRADYFKNPRVKMINKVTQAFCRKILKKELRKKEKLWEDSPTYEKNLWRKHVQHNIDNPPEFDSDGAEVITMDMAPGLPFHRKGKNLEKYKPRSTGLRIDEDPDNY